jgi:hypothetical protein
MFRNTSGAVTSALVDDHGRLMVVSSASRTDATLTRPADTTAYTAGDVIGGASAIATFTDAGPVGGHVLITRASLLIDNGTIQSGMGVMRLHLYDAAPTAIADNAAFDIPSGDRTKYLGYIDIGTPVDMGSTCFVETSGESTTVPKQVKLAAGSTTLYGLLETRSAYTPTSGTAYRVRLHAVAI